MKFIEKSTIFLDFHGHSSEFLGLSQKFLAKSGIGSRRYCEDLIKSNQVTVNGKIAKIGSVVHKDDVIEYEGKIVAHKEFDTKLLIPGNSVRENEIALDMKDKMIAKSEMADSLIKILDMWKEGVLIMDEVDVLLHPLRSELNFPIGHKYPIDLSGYRWNLPIHLCDAVFYAETGKLSDEPKFFVVLKKQILAHISNSK